MENKNKYFPDYAIPPGETLLEVIESKGITQSELAERMGRPKKTINEIIKGKASITPETSIQLERVLNIPARFWDNLEKNYRSDLARIAEVEKLKNDIAWSKRFPLRKMIAYGWIADIKDNISMVDQLLKFFGVASTKAWQSKWGRKTFCSLSFRKSKAYETDESALSVWLCQGMRIAEKQVVEPFDKKAFAKVVKECVPLTTYSPDRFQPQLVKMCAKCGVIVIFVKELPKVPVHGVTYWDHLNRPVIQLSLRYKTNDQFWFSFFHEAGHVLLHGKKDFIYSETAKSWENEADNFAKDVLIDKNVFIQFVEEHENKFSLGVVREFAKSQHIAPGIVVGRLQHEKKIGYNKLNGLKLSFDWEKSS